MCGHNDYKTGDDSNIVLAGTPSTLPNHDAPESIDLNAFHNMDLKLVYLERNVMNRNNDLYKLFLNRYCDLTRDHMYSLISLARSNSEEFAWVYMKHPGYTAVARGEVIYLIQCKATKVKVISTDNCYQELVVKDNQNNTMLNPPLESL